MSSKQTITIKDFQNGGGNLTVEIKSAIISEKSVDSTKIIKIKITRQPDKHSTRFGMFAFLRNTQPGYQTTGFSEATLTFDRYSATGKFLSRSFIVFYGVAVENVRQIGNDEEEITFVAAQKAGEFVTANLVGTP